MWLIKHNAMKPYGGVQIQLPNSRSSRFIPIKSVPDTHWKEVWMGPKSGLGRWKSLNICLSWDVTISSPVDRYRRLGERPATVFRVD